MNFFLLILSALIITIFYFNNLLTPLPLFKSSYHFGILSVIIALIILGIWSKTRKIFYSSTRAGRSIIAYLFIVSLSGMISDYLNEDTLKRIAYLIVASACFFITSVITQVNRRFTNISLLVFTVLNLLATIFSYLFLFYPEVGISILEKLTQENTYGFVLFDYSRGRIHNLGTLIITVLIPFYLLKRFSFLNPKNISGFITLILGISAILLTNQRSYILSVLTVTTILLLTTARLKIIKISLKIIFPFFVLSIAAISAGFQFFTPIKIIDRFLLKHPNDISTITARRRFIGYAIEIFSTDPIFGSGPGTYRQLVTFEKIEPRITVNFRQQFTRDFIVFGSDTPHNIFLYVLAETGIAGLIAFLYMLSCFISTDIVFLKQVKSNSRLLPAIPLISVTWIYLLVGVTEVLPPYFTIIFFITRGVLDAEYIKNEKAK